MPNRLSTLFAQTDHGENLSPNNLPGQADTLLLIMMSGGILILLLVTWTIFRAMKMSERSREFQHAERVKAIEAGRPWQDPPEVAEKALGSRFWICFWIMLFGAAVPFSSVPSSLTHMEDIQERVMFAAYISAGVAGTTASICSAIIMCRATKPESTNESDNDRREQA